MTKRNIDLHCDLLVYLMNPNSRIDDREIGCSLPFLKEGNVGLQVMAIFSPTLKESTHYGKQQSKIFSNLIEIGDFHLLNKLSDLEDNAKTFVIAAIENASGFCEEDEKLEQGFKNLENIIKETQKLLYIGMTHHTENRFGGGNFSEVGLKEDGKVLLDYLADKNIVIDLAHTSDALAFGILNYIDQKNYKIHVFTSHSNFRSVCNHKRNLPDELVKEIIHRKGLIGINFVKDFIGNDSSENLYKHIKYGMENGAENHLVYGGDFFFDKSHPDKSRYPFFFDEYNNSTAYNFINKRLSQDFSPEIMRKISHQNAENFLISLGY